MTYISPTSGRGEMSSGHVLLSLPDGLRDQAHRPIVLRTRTGGNMDTWAKYDAERGALCDDLAALGASQWDTQSLCDEWKVRDVVAHLVAECDRRTGAMLVGFVRSGLDPNRYIAREALLAGEASPESLLTQLRATIGKRKTPPLAKPMAMLIDTVCHSGDIRRPLGINRKPAEETLVEVAEEMKSANFPLGTKKRITGAASCCD